jgi:hypothetical protein
MDAVVAARIGTNRVLCTCHMAASSFLDMMMMEAGKMCRTSRTFCHWLLASYSRIETNDAARFG